MLVSFWILARSSERRHSLVMVNPFELEMETTKNKLCNNDDFFVHLFLCCKIFLTLELGLHVAPVEKKLKSSVQSLSVHSFLHKKLHVEMKFVVILSVYKNYNCRLQRKNECARRGFSLHNFSKNAVFVCNLIDACLRQTQFYCITWIARKKLQFFYFSFLVVFILVMDAFKKESLNYIAHKFKLRASMENKHKSLMFVIPAKWLIIHKSVYSWGAIQVTNLAPTRSPSSTRIF